MTVADVEDVFQKDGRLPEPGVSVLDILHLRGEPIVNTPQNAYNTFSKSEIGVLVLENFMIRK